MSTDILKSQESIELELSERMKNLSQEIRTRIFPYDSRRMAKLSEMADKGEEMKMDVSEYRNQISQLEEEWPENDLRDYVDNVCRVLETNEVGIDMLMKRAEEDIDKIDDNEIPLNKIQEKLSFFTESLKGIINLINDFLKNLTIKIEFVKSEMDTSKYENLFPALEEKRKKFSALERDCTALLNQIQNKALEENSSAA